LYACHVGGAGGDDIQSFQVHADGSLTLLQTSIAACNHLDSAINPPLVIRPGGNFAYYSQGAGVFLFSIDSLGDLSLIGSVLANSSIAAIDPSGKFAYVPTGTVLSIDATGNLTNPLTIPPFHAIAFSPQGHFAYTVDGASATVSAHSV